MRITSQNSLQKCKILLYFCNTPKTIPAETFQNKHQISIRSRSKAQDFLGLLAVDDSFSCTFIGSSHSTEEITRESCTFVSMLVECILITQTFSCGNEIIFLSHFSGSIEPQCMIFNVMWPNRLL